jgi:hypothetical protein
MKKTPLEMALDAMARDIDKRVAGPVKTALQRQLDLAHSFLEFDPEHDHDVYVAGFKDGMKINTDKTVADVSNCTQDQH